MKKLYIVGSSGTDCVLILDIFINMRQCCGNWKNWEKQFFVTKWSIFYQGSRNFQESCILVLPKGLYKQKLKKSFGYREMIRK